MKRIFALLMALCLCCVTTVTAFAAEPVDADKVDYLNYEFPEDAVVLYQGEDGVMYMSEQKSAELATLASDTTYGYVYFDPGHWNISKDFSIENPHSMPFTTTYGTFKIESDYSNAKVEMNISNNQTTYATYDVSIQNNDIHFEFQSITQNLTVRCYPKSTSNVYGIRAMCWLY